MDFSQPNDYDHKIITLNELVIDPNYYDIDNSKQNRTNIEITA